MPRPGTPVVHPRLLDHLRPTATGALPDECIIAFPAGGPVVSDDGLDVTYPDPVIRYAGPCRVEPFAEAARIVQAMERATTLRIYHVALPWHAGPVELGDAVTVTTSGDPDLAGRPLRVIDIPGDSLLTERRLLCEEVVG